MWPIGFLQYHDLGNDASLQVASDGRDGAFAGIPSYFDHGSEFQFVRVFGNGTVPCCDGARTSLAQHEFAPAPGGGLWVASFNGTGPYGYYEPGAFLAVDQSEPSSWTGFFEYHEEVLMHWYDDIGLAATADGGSVFYWSQAHDRFGLFARRFTATGQVTGVTPVVDAKPALHSLRFTSGAGVRARLTLPAGGHSSLALFDVAGRRRASLDLSGRTGTIDVDLPGTASLLSGIYFGRLDAGNATFRSKVTVLR